MQTLWTRALQVKSTCRCPSCASPQRALSRRVNTAPTRHRIRPFGDSLALFGTTIFVAAAADARYKDMRREELDGTLLRAREDLQAIDEDQARRLNALGIYTRPERRGDVKDISYQYGPSSTQNTNTEVPWLQLRKASGRQEEPTKEELAAQSREDNIISTPAQVEENMDSIPKQAQADKQKPSKSRASKQTATRKLKEQYRSNRAYYAAIDSQVSQDKLTRVLLNATPVDPHHGRPVEQCWSSRANQRLTERQLLVRQRAVAKLIYKLILLRVHHTSSFDVEMPDGRIASYTHEDTQPIRDTVRELDTTHRGLLQSAAKATDLLQWISSLPFPLYKRHGEELRNENDRGLQQQAEQLHEFFGYPMDTTERLSHLCSILACQQWAPNTHIFNLLLLKLSELGLSKAVHYVTEAFIESGAVLNEISHTAILNSYASSGRVSNFMSYLTQLDGIGAAGLLPLEMKIPPNRPDLSEEQLKSYEHLVEGSESSVTYAFDRSKHAIDDFQSEDKARKVGRKVPRTPYMYEAILSGLLRFSKIDKAMQEYSRMIKSGIRPTTDMYYSFLRYCVRTKAWSLGWNLWLQLNTESQQLDSVLYYWMLQLCAFCGKKKQFQTIVDTALRKGDIGLPLNIDHFRWTEKEYTEVFRKSDLIERMQREVQVPDYTMDSIQYPQPQFNGNWPANLYTMVQNQCSTVLQIKQDRIGATEDVTRDIEAFTAQSGVKESLQWLQKDTSSGTISLTESSEWTRRGRCEFEEYIAANTKMISQGRKLAPHMATLRLKESD